MGTKLQRRLNLRRNALGIPRSVLARLSSVSEDTVDRVLTDPDAVPTEQVAAVGQVLGVDAVTAAKTTKLSAMLRPRAAARARYTATIAQGLQVLEASAVSPDGFERLVQRATRRLLAGDRRKLWVLG